MSIQVRQYRHIYDYQRVSDFLIEHYQPGNQDGNWVEPAWEYMHGHPGLDRTVLEKIGVWEEAGKIVAVAHYEGGLGEAFFQFHPGYRHLRDEMLTYAESHLHGISAKDGRRYVQARDPAAGRRVRCAPQPRAMVGTGNTPECPRCPGS